MGDSGASGVESPAGGSFGEGRAVPECGEGRHEPSGAVGVGSSKHGVQRRHATWELEERCARDPNEAPGDLQSVQLMRAAQLAQAALS